MMNTKNKTAAGLHDQVPPDWYFASIHKNLLQKFVHSQRFAEVKKIIPKDSGGRILDIGCADGTFTNQILQKSNADEIIAIDVLPSSIKWAKKHWKDKRIRFSLGDAHKLNYKASSFDAVFALEVLEHVFEPKKVLAQIKRVMKNNAYAIFLVPAETLLFQIIWFFWTKGRGKIWKETHLHAYKNGHLVNLAKAVGFEIEVDKKIIFGTLHLIKVRKK